MTRSSRSTATTAKLPAVGWEPSQESREQAQLWEAGAALARTTSRLRSDEQVARWRQLAPAREENRELAVVGWFCLTAAACLAGMLVWRDNAAVAWSLFFTMCGLVVCMWAAIWWLNRGSK